MVSSALKMDLPDLLQALERIKRESGRSEEYRNWHKKFPKDWPL
jgi:hypothetical protein